MDDVITSTRKKIFIKKTFLVKGFNDYYSNEPQSEKTVGFPIAVAFKNVLRNDGSVSQLLANFMLILKVSYKSNYAPPSCDLEVSFKLANSHQVYRDVASESFLLRLNTGLKKISESNKDPPVDIDFIYDRDWKCPLKLPFEEKRICLAFYIGKDENKSHDCLQVELTTELEYVSTDVQAESKAIDMGDDAVVGLISCLQAAKDLPDLHDFELLCDGKKFPCSKFVLMARSDVFRAMLSHSETKESQSRQVIIDDCTPEALEIFLQLMYTGQANIQETHLSTLFQLVDKYQVLSIKQSLVKHMIENVSLDNVCQMAILAHVHQEHLLLERSLRIMKSNLAEVKRLHGWREIEEKHSAIAFKLLFLDEKDH